MILPLRSGWYSSGGGISLESSERRGAENSLLKRMKALQGRLEQSRAKLPATAGELFEELRRILQQAVRAEVLRTPAYDVSKLLKQTVPTRSRHGGNLRAITCGPKDFNRLAGNVDPKERLVREDGAVIHFTIMVEEVPGAEQLRLHAYDFELYFPSKEPTEFVRFDLNEPGHDNEDDGVRSHFHPSHEDLQVPSPVLAPAEALSFLLYRMRLKRDVPRS